jgi:hypothetical protein
MGSFFRYVLYNVFSFFHVSFAILLDLQCATRNDKGLIEKEREQGKGHLPFVSGRCTYLRYLFLGSEIVTIACIRDSAYFILLVPEDKRITNFSHLDSKLR